MIQLSVAIITLNEERNIERCIQSILPVADEIIVVDSFSTDKTEEICKKYSVTFIKHEFKNYLEQKNFAMQQCSNDYVLSLDADEALNEQLTLEILKVKRNWEYDGYSFNRLTNYCGKFIKHCGWYPNAFIRLWDRRKGVWGGGNLHEKIIMHGNATKSHIAGDLLHYSYYTIDEHIKQANNFSSLAAEVKFKKGSTTNIFKIWGLTKFRFFRDYIIKLGILDGFYGYIICKINAQEVFLKYSKLLQKQREAKLQNISRFSSSLFITTYNNEESLELVLLSVLKQKMLPMEVIIADDGSHSTTKDLIEKFQSVFPVPLIHCWHEDKGFRLSEIRNKAIVMCKGEYLIMIDGDIILHPYFIEDHMMHAKPGYFVQGSRVLLSKDLSAKRLHTKNIQFHPFVKGIKNIVNAMHSTCLSRIISPKYGAKDHKGVRGCNMAFWKADVVKVNGFNQDFIGWGREDSEFVVRMLNSGVIRKNLKFGAIGYHIWHKENLRKETFDKNQALLDAALQEYKHSCSNGINRISS